ncbi:cytochrome c [Ramlibacter sp. XY19]|uniref:c-type cytochrome n=1 Tax=Ramlibacter paludis TaxID=2908000 RepID=UPI0023DBF437|nr:cytochrome c [Ramlibacter paludis]MCG2594227.1 cytochrome c [Ramlibacter paludis]
MRQRLLGLVLAVAALPLAAFAQEPSVDQGRRLYGSYCARCHGLNMVTPGAAFFDLRTLTPAEQDRFERSVTQGLRAMPAWGAILKPADVQALWLYVMAGK